MKSIIKKLLLFFLFCSFFQTVISADSKAMLDIRKEYKIIRDAIPSLTKREISLNGHSTEGGRCIVSQDKNEETRLITAGFYGETGKSIYELYLKNGQVFFIFSQDHRYNAPIYFDEKRAKAFGVDPFDSEKTKVYEDRYYYRNNRLIRWINRQKIKVDINSNQAKEENERVTSVKNTVVSNCK